MNIRNIRYFVTIAQERSITSAARKLFVSQQSLSGQLKKLEEEAGTPLFYREVPLRLTPAGEVLYQDAGILLQKAGFETEIYEKNSVPGGQCTGWKREGYTIDNCVHLRQVSMRPGG